MEPVMFCLLTSTLPIFKAEHSWLATLFDSRTITEQIIATTPFLLGSNSLFRSSRLSGAESRATFQALLKTYSYLTPDLWRETRFVKSPYQEFTDFLAKPNKIGVIEDLGVEKSAAY